MCNLCNSGELQSVLKKITQALIVGRLDKLQSLNLFDIRQELSEAEEIATALNHTVQHLLDSQASVATFPKEQLTLAEVSKSEFGRNTSHMETYVFRQTDAGAPTYFGLGGHSDGIALFEHASSEEIARRKHRAAKRTQLDDYRKIGDQREQALNSYVRSYLSGVLATTMPTDRQRELLELALGKNWLEKAQNTNNWIPMGTVFGLLELMGHTVNPVFPGDDQ